MKKFSFDKDKLVLLYFLIILIILIFVLGFFELNISNIFIDSTIESLTDKSEQNANIVNSLILDKASSLKIEDFSFVTDTENDENRLYFDKNKYISNNDLINYFSKSSFENSEYIFITDHFGNIFFTSENEYKICYYQNLYNFFTNVNFTSTKSLDTVQDDIVNKRKGSFIYNINGQERICTYAPIDCTDWYVFTMVPMSYVNSQQKTISAIFLIIIIINVFAFIVSYIILKHNFKNNDYFNFSNSKLLNIYKHNQSLLLEFDFKNELIEMTGDSEFIFGKKNTKMPFSEFKTFLQNVHEDDLILIENIKNFIKNQGFNYTAEFRLKCNDSNYYWFHMNSSNIFNKEGNSIKYLVHLVNVNSRSISDNINTFNKTTDELTGLLNNEFFEYKTHAFLTKTKNKSTSALFLIDLDDLKKINIKLGHHFGDLSIKNASTNISLVFSQKDIIGRIRGNRFGVLLCLNKNLTEEKAYSIINEKAQILCNILNLSYSDNQRNAKSTASIGISLYPFHGQNYSELLKSAESALFSVKQNGKNGYKIYSQEKTEKNYYL